jgi:hypothetical protein
MIAFKKVKGISALWFGAQGTEFRFTPAARTG